MFNFKDKNVLVTGGTRGIGKSIVEMFAQCHANVVYLYNSSDDIASEIDREWSNNTVKVKGYKADITDSSRISDTVEEILKDFGKIDILINNAGITKDSYLMMMKDDDWLKVIDVNLNGLFYLTKQLIPNFITNHYGKIINITSVSGIIGKACQTNYSATKAGIIGFTKSLSKELAGKGINVNAIAPGYIGTEMLETIPEKLRKDFEKSIPAKRIGKTEDVVYPVMFLASDYSNYIHGEVIVVDGGLTA